MFKAALDIHLEEDFLFEYSQKVQNRSVNRIKDYRVRPLGFLDLSPAFGFSKFPDTTGIAQDTIVSFPCKLQFLEILNNLKLLRDLRG
jgi:hypothetical protein